MDIPWSQDWKDYVLFLDVFKFTHRMELGVAFVRFLHLREGTKNSFGVIYGMGICINSFDGVAGTFASMRLLLIEIALNLLLQAMILKNSEKNLELR